MSSPIRGPWPEPEQAPRDGWVLSVEQVRAALAKEPGNVTYRRLWWEMTGEVERQAPREDRRRPWMGGNE